MTTSPNLGITYLEQNQAQKHLTVNEGFEIIDAITQFVVQSAVLEAAPGSPVEGQAWIPNQDADIATDSPGDAWEGQEGNVAVYTSGGWLFLTPVEGWEARVGDTGGVIYYNGSSWVDRTSTLNAGYTQLRADEELLDLTSATTTSISFPNQCIILGASVRVVTAITGAASFDAGDGSTVDRFGGSLGIAEGSTNQGLVGPAGNYAATTVTLTPNGGAFTAGEVRVCLHYIATQPPQS